MTSALFSNVIGRTGIRSAVARVVRWSGVLVLNYHRIGDGSRSLFDRGLWSASADAFAEQVRYYRRHFDVIGPKDLPEVLARRRGRYVLITFDDGYRDNYEVAYPILKAEGATASFFVTTGFVDFPRIAWWDEIAWMVRTSRCRSIDLPDWLDAPVRLSDDGREAAVRGLLRVYKSLPEHATGRYLDAVAEASRSGRFDSSARQQWWMTWDMLREMQSGGMTIGGHTVNHPVLANASPDVQRHEIEACGQRLAAELGGPMRFFSYPVGGPKAFDGVTREYLARAGVRYAFSYYSGHRQFGSWDDYDIGRVPIESHVTRHWFRSIVTLPQWFA